jgi:hypothetical protein
MATISKTQGTSLFALATVASGAVGLGAAADVSTKLAATVFIHVGRTIATALSNGVKVRVEGSAKSSLDGFWFPLAEFVTGVTVSTTTATLTTGTTAGTATLPMTATAGIVIGDRVYIREAGAETNSEFGRVITINTNTSIVLEDGTLYNHTITTTKVWSQAEFFVAQLDLTAIGRIRVVIDCASALSGQTIVAEAFMVTGDSIS